MSNSPTTEVRRIIDANLNRAREALRVVEDYARFALDHARIAGRVKEMRHRLHAVSDALGAGEFVDARDSVADVGRALTTPGEGSRADAEDVLRTNLKRVQESLRTLEEYAKTFDEPAAREIEQIRYDAYTLESLLLTLAEPHRLLDAARLYVIVTRSIAGGRDPAEITRAAIDGGATIVQLREKEMPDGEFLRIARRVREITESAGALLIINDRVHVALACGADGVHVGQDDLPVGEARRLLGPRRIIGLSTHSLEQAAAAERAGADYIGYGPIFTTQTKETAAPVGPERAAEIQSRVMIPMFAIGGLSAGNLDQLTRAGVVRVAVCSAIIADDDVSAAAAEIRECLA